MTARPSSGGRARWPLILLAAAALVVVFLLGVGLGLALEERPQTGGTHTSVRTFQPLRDSGTSTVNVTVP